MSEQSASSKAEGAALVASPESVSQRVEFLLMYRDHPLPHWHRYDAFLTLDEAQAMLNGLVQRGLRPQGVDFQIVRVTTETRMLLVESRPFPTLQAGDQPLPSGNATSEGQPDA